VAKVDPLLDQLLGLGDVAGAARDSDMISSMMLVISPVDCRLQRQVADLVGDDAEALAVLAAWAAMMEALRASRLVRLVMSLMTLTIPSIRLLFSLSRLMLV